MNFECRSRFLAAYGKRVDAIEGDFVGDCG